MTFTLAAEQFQLWVADPDNAAFLALDGELSSRMELARSYARNPALGGGNWHHCQPLAGQLVMRIVCAGQSHQGRAETILQQAMLLGIPCRLRLKLQTQNWIEGDFLITHFDLDATLPDAANFSFGAESQNAPTITPPIF